MRYSGNGGKCHGREISDRMDLEEQVGEHAKRWSLWHGDIYT